MWGCILNRWVASSISRHQQFTAAITWPPGPAINRPSPRRTKKRSHPEAGLGTKADGVLPTKLTAAPTQECHPHRLQRRCHPSHAPRDRPDKGNHLWTEAKAKSDKGPQHTLEWKRTSPRENTQKGKFHYHYYILYLYTE